jgi:hypothetical protein
MSSPKAAAKIATRTATKTVRRPTASVKKIIPAKPGQKPKVVATGLSADAIRLAGEIERAFQKSDQALSEEAMQALMGTLCRVYSAQVENGSKYTPIAEGQVVSPTGVMVTASGLLRAANLAVFELGMWQSWTGR